MIVFNRIGIIGLGVIGIAIAKAIKNLDNGIEIFGSNRNREISDHLFENKVIDEILPIKEIFKLCDLIILSTPVNIISKTLQENRENIMPNSIIIDVGSTKSFAENFSDISNFIPCHPIFGGLPIDYGNIKESIAKISHEDLKNKEVYVIKMNENSTAAIKKVNEFWKSIGLKTKSNLSLSEHDKFFSSVSHFPHFLGITLINIFDDKINISKNDIKFDGFFRTSAKISNYKMWIPIFTENLENINQDINNFINYFNRAENNRDFSEKEYLKPLISSCLTHLLTNMNISKNKYKKYSISSFLSKANRKKLKINENLRDKFIKELEIHYKIIQSQDVEKIREYYENLLNRFNKKLKI